MDRCWIPRQHRRDNAEAPCEVCADIVRRNVDDFVNGTVLPELRRLKSNETGLEGFVIPPRWVLDVDTRGSWSVKTSPEKEFVFSLHDLVLHNTLLSTQTLLVVTLIDLEEDEYFPPEHAAVEVRPARAV